MAVAQVRRSFARTPRLRLILGVLAACVIGIAAPAAASAATLHVTSSADSGPGSLRAVVASASDGDTIIIDPGVEPMLASGPISVQQVVAIQGQGPRATRIDAGGTSGVLYVGGGNQYGPNGTVSISQVTLTAGSNTNGPGGGVEFASFNDLSLSDVEILGNTASQGGGGISIGCLGGSVVLDRVTIANNNTAANGGGIISFCAAGLTATNTTIANNTAVDGGGIYFSNGNATLAQTTIYGNTASDGTGGNVDNSGGLVSLKDTIIASGHAPVITGSNCSGSTTYTTSQGANLEDTTPSQCSLSAAQGDLIGVNPQLSPLANNGGPTDTMALGSSSPAIDAVPAANCAVALDQRGLPRPDSSESACDIGAYELQDSTPVTLACAPLSTAVGQATTCSATVTNPAGALAGPPTGVVSFASNGPGAFGGAGGCTLSGSGGMASCAVAYTPNAAGSGQHHLTASYGGDSTFASGSASTDVAVTLRPTTVAVHCAPVAIHVGQTTMCKATVTDQLGTGAGPVPSWSGVVTFAGNGPGGFGAGGTCSKLAASGASASCSVPFTPSAAGSGTDSISAAYAGDAARQPASGSTRLAVRQLKPVAPAVAGVTANLTVISGTVLIKPPRATSFVPLASRPGLASADGFVPLKGATVSVPIGSSIDAHRKGAVVKLSTAADYRPATDRRHTLQTGTFAAAIFTIEQESARQAAQRLHRKRSRLRGIPATDLRLRTPVGAVSKARCHRQGAPGKGLVREFSGTAKGLFRTIGATSITTVRNAVWIVTDRCDGTLTEVGRGHATVTSRRHPHRHALVVGPGQGVLIKGRFL